MFITWDTVMSKSIVFIVAIGCMAIGFLVGFGSNGKMVASDCTNLRMTVISGQTIACKLHNHNPKRVL
jgi:hypothetical protein